jgi:SAM-dependent methyltransferase
MDLLAEQMEYYRQQAAEYDQGWFREGRHELEPLARERWYADVAEVERALDEFGPTGDVLELACGTGLWTRHLARYARQVVAVDASAEMIELNRARVPDAPVSYVEADLFAWVPPARAFDVCFFGFWLSHVPAGRTAAFWATVARALRPGGRVFLVDDAIAGQTDGEVQERALNDGRRFRIVKRQIRASALKAGAATLGWNLHARVTANGHFIYAHGIYTHPDRRPVGEDK